MNRAARRDLARRRRRGVIDPAIDPCPHGFIMKTDGKGDPLCPYRCGFIPSIPQARKSPRALVSEAKRSRSLVKTYDKFWNLLEINGLPVPPWMRHVYENANPVESRRLT